MNQVQQQSATTMFLYSAAGQPVAVTLPPQPNPYELYKSGQSRVAGGILIAAGILSIIFNIVGITLQEAMSYSGTGFWCGVMVSRHTTTPVDL